MKTFLLILLCVIIACVGTMIFVVAMQKDDLRHVEENGVFVRATVVDVVDRSDATSDSYDVYVSYQYEGQVYERVKYVTTYHRAQTGDVLNVRIDPRNPGKLPNRTKTSAGAIILTGGLLICLTIPLIVGEVVMQNGKPQRMREAYQQDVLTAETVEQEEQESRLVRYRVACRGAAVYIAVMLGCGLGYYAWRQSLTAMWLALPCAAAALVYFILRPRRKTVALVRDTFLGEKTQKNDDSATPIKYCCFAQTGRVPSDKCVNRMFCEGRMLHDVFPAGTKVILAKTPKGKVLRVFRAARFQADDV